MVFITFASAILAMFWVVLTGSFTIYNYILGLIIGYPIALISFDEERHHVSIARVPAILGNAIYYILYLYWRIFTSGIQMALRVLSPDMGLNTGIIAVDTEDDTDDVRIAGLSAHSISAMPGDLVVDFSEDNQVMYVHSLDVAASLNYLYKDQDHRLVYFHRIFNNDADDRKAKAKNDI